MRITLHHRAALMVLLTMLCVAQLPAQQLAGDVVGTMSGAAHIYSGEFSDDLWGAGAFLSLHYAPISRLSIEGRFGLGDIRWKITPSQLAAYPGYFGQGAELGDPYPGSLTTIESENESRITTGDLLVNYVLVDNIAAIPFISVGVGLVDFSPTNAQEHEALPNNAAGIYDYTVLSIPVGGGVQIPFSDRAGIVFRAEHRFVFSEYLDDLAANGMNDAVTSLSIGLTYRFTDPHPRSEPGDCWETVTCSHCGFWWEEPCGQPIHHVCPACAACLCQHPCFGCCDHCCCTHNCCCCCCPPAAAGGGGGSGGGGGGGGEGSGGGGGAPSEPAPEPPPAREAFSKDIRFKLDTDEFDFSYPQTKKNLEQLRDYMKEAPEGHQIVIEGHASGEGPPQRNQVLSDIRSKKIKEWLIQQGVAPDKIRGTMGYGSSMPKVTEPTPEQMKSMSKQEIEDIRAQNRRIEIHVLKDAYQKEADDARRKWEEQERERLQKDAAVKS